MFAVKVDYDTFCYNFQFRLVNLDLVPKLNFLFTINTVISKKFTVCIATMSHDKMNCLVSI